jgi:nicotinamidase-related amidase
VVKRALLVIDVQNEYVTGALPIEYPPLDVSLANIGETMDAANAAGIPIVVVQHAEPQGSQYFDAGTPTWELHSVVADRLSSTDLTIHKNLPSAFVGTDLEAWLIKQGIDTVTIVGYMTNVCDQSTANWAMHLGLQAEFISDASGTVSVENESGKVNAQQIHETLCVVMQSDFAKVMTTREWVNLVNPAS